MGDLLDQSLGRGGIEHRYPALARDAAFGGEIIHRWIGHWIGCSENREDRIF